MKSRKIWKPNAKQREIMNHEINKHILEVNAQFQEDFDAMILWYIHAHLGFGKKRLKRFYDGFRTEYERLIAHYQMPGDTGWLCRQKLKEIGVDIDEWAKKSKENEE